METDAQREARYLIEKINREHTLNGALIGSRFEKLVSNCLEILSSQLYEKSTHFLLELIQNADDNTYNCRTPTLSFSYKPGGLRIDCNEVGFTADNVEAICGVSRSTKSSKVSDGEYIGEKGIGFKSVFKAADIVWISSREFTFKFDKTKFLGMVAPIWEEFPELTQVGYTSIYLQLSKGYDEETLIHELLNFDNNLLIFLRRIEEINLRVVRQDEQVWEKRIRKTEGRYGTDQLTILHIGERSFRYLIRTHVIKDLPQERKRLNWTQTKMLLAFPTAEFQEQPRLVPQNVYASLPIRNFGLKFLVQGDFLLTASREDIESTLPWNRTIRDALAEAFLQSVRHFNEGDLKYVWPYYLPSTTTATCSFLEPAIISILAQLKESYVLESCAGEMVKPSSLKHVPLDQFADGEGNPFTLSPRTEAGYLSLKYPAWVIEGTRSIGVSTLSPQKFLADLELSITEDPATFRTRPASWHSQLSEILIKLAIDAELMSLIQDLCLIPLHDGNWTSARGQSMFFSKNETCLEIPSGIEVLIVDSNAESDPHRRKLFATLGVKAWEAAEICRLVLQVHESLSFDPKTSTVDQLISHAAFLYKASWQPPKTADLWFATMQDERCQGRKLYMPGSIETDSPAARIFAQLQKHFPVVHDDYWKAFPRDAEWPMWLVGILGLSKVPRLITPFVEPRPQPTQTEETRGEVKPPLSTDETEVVYVEGDEVAFKEMLPGTTKKYRWAWGRVVTVKVHGKIRRYRVEARDIGIGEGPSFYDCSAIEMVRIPPENARFEKYPPLGACVLALFPETNAFMPADVKGILDQAHSVQLLFDGIEDSGEEYSKGRMQIVHRRFVLDATLPQTPPQRPIHDHAALEEQKDSRVLEILPPGYSPSRSHFRSSSGAVPLPESHTNTNIPLATGIERSQSNESIESDNEPLGNSSGFPRDMDFAPNNGSLDVLQDFDFDSFLHQDGGVEDNFNFDTSAFLDESLITAELGRPDLRIRQENKREGEGILKEIKSRESSNSLLVPLEGEGAIDGDQELKRSRRGLTFQEDKLEEERRVEIAGKVTSKDIPDKTTLSTPVGGTASFCLSEEFVLMFRECNSSDVLQLLRDNWHYYSQWIDGAHMQWQTDSFLKSSIQLKKNLAGCLVQSAKGFLPLQETVLPTIDVQLDEGCLIPAVDLQDPQHSDWAFLTNFGVLMKGDIYYYLRCLIAISEEQCLDVDCVTYIYEQIQTRYKGNENLISAAFNERDIILVHPESRGLTKPAGWINIKECFSREIAIGSEYPSSSYLFRCLISPKGDPIAPIVATASFITSSTKLEDISRLFRNVSTELKDVNASKAAQLLKPLQNKSIFPITNGLGKRGYDSLLDLHNTTWFIADQPLLRESFHGKVPLLALPIEDISTLEDMFRVLRLDSRLLSKRTTTRTQAKGRVAMHWAYTSSLRKKSPFIKALIPQSLQDRITIVRQMEQVRVNVATDISQTFLLNLDGNEIHGSPVRGQVSLSYAENILNILMIEECAEAKCPPHELVTLIAKACEITDAKHFSLLYTVLSNSSMKSILSAFTQQGIYVKGLVLDKPKSRYQAQKGDLMRIPSPFRGHINNIGRSFQGLPAAMRLDSFQGGRHFRHGDEDRRLPIMRLIQADGLVSEDIQARRLVLENEKIDGWDHIQYLGEHMVSKLLHNNLGEAYDPERDWTSRLRSRSGHKPFEDPAPSAAFTMRNSEILKELTAFVIKFGRSQTPKWKENLRANPPSAYHFDLAVSAGRKASSFVITTSQVERMRHFRMAENARETNTDIVVLVRVSDVYSDESLSVDFFVDPWCLFDSNGLNFEENWIVRGAIQEINSDSGSTRKRRKLYIPSVRWAMPTSQGMYQNGHISLRGSRERETYTHRALETETIRLLYLLPGETIDQLQGVIIHVPYNAAGNYRALSYVWGTDKQTQELMTPDGILPITFSLSKALRGLRHQNKPVMLWVDAICINQKDTKEKGQQIRLLPKIFQTAASTYAFLEGGNGSDTAIEMLMQVRAKAACDEKSKFDLDAIDGAESEYGVDSDSETVSERSIQAGNWKTPTDRTYSEDWPKDLPSLPTSWRHRCIPYLVDPIWSSVRELFDLPWFRRVWIIQEIVGAPHVKILCGKWIIDWSDLHLAIDIVDREIQLFDDDLSPLQRSWEPFLSLAAQREWEARNHRWTLIMLLEHFRYAESTLSRDRLFALLGLASDGNEAAFEPDYDSPLEAVMLKFAQVFVRQGRGMQLLYRAAFNLYSDRFPSWIPDWTVKRPSSLHDSSEGGVSFAASGPQQAKIKCNDGTDELLVEGYEVDIIESISTSSNLETEWETYFKEIDDMIDSAVLSPVRDSLEDLKWKVPVAGVLWPKVPVSAGLDLKSSYTAFRKYLKHNTRNGKAREVNGVPVGGYYHEQMLATSNCLWKQSASYVAALQDTLQGWKFIVTKKGFVGVVPNLSGVGDVVAIFKGGRVPFILRSGDEDREGAWRLVGEGFVHSMMNGEGLGLFGVREGEFRLY